MLIECALLIAPDELNAVAGFRCNETVFKIHTSAHLKNQPSAVNRHVTRTQDVLAARVKPESALIPNLQLYFQELPCIVIGDTDTSNQRSKLN